MNTGSGTGDFGDTDEAWKVLELVNGWVKHAEAKGGLALATSGVLAGLFVSLISDLAAPSWLLTLMLILAGVSVLSAGVLGAVAVVPRTWKRSPPTGAIYYDHIARAYPNGSAMQVKGVEDFKERFAEVTGDKSALFEDLATQVWANSHVAAAKYKWSNLAVVFVILAAVFLAISAAVLLSR